MSHKKEDYIKTLFELGGHRNNVSNKLIAERLTISPPSVTEMMLSLEKHGWVKYTPYKGSLLTDEGANMAKELIYKHRIWEVFLVEHLNYPIDEVHDEAEVLEHTTSIKLAEKLEAYLDYPKFCPHGGAIPLLEIEEQASRTYPLTEELLGKTVKIARIVNESNLVSYFKRLNLNIGDQIILEKFEPSIDLLYIKNLTQDEDSEISSKVAQQLFVEPMI